MVECALALPVMLLLLFAMLDLGLATTRFNTLAEAARRIARAAVIHGSDAPAGVGEWGPNEFVGTAADDSSIVAPTKRILPTLQDGAVNIRVSWPDGNNRPRDRVHVEVGYVHEPLIPGLAPWGSLELHAFSTMRIVN
jgi:Flp pilus assembly protein TadG